MQGKQFCFKPKLQYILLLKYLWDDHLSELRVSSTPEHLAYIDDVFKLMEFSF